MNQEKNEERKMKILKKNSTEAILWKKKIGKDSFQFPIRGNFIKKQYFI